MVKFSALGHSHGAVGGGVGPTMEGLTGIALGVNERFCKDA
ncbi:MAG: hypothetical protein ACOC3T_05115 [Bacteroidota bacterium]